MVELTLPNCEARVSPELLALLRGGSWKASATALTDPAETDRVERAAALKDDPATLAEPRSQWPFVSLQRDGARPMRFPGLMVTSHSESLDVQVDGQPVPVERHLALYLTQEGGTVAHVICAPADDQPARPIHRAAHLTSAEELAALLRVASPDTCFAVSRVAAQWEGPGPESEGPFHTSRSVYPSDNTE